MVIDSAFLEAHSYSGGLRYTPLGVDTRPDWAPPPETVGWRDDFELDVDDTVVEFHQRSFNNEVITWLAVYRRSIDAKLGDRQNHAGIGVWLRGMRIADGKLLLLALQELASLLSKNPDPQMLSDSAIKFGRFLKSYIVPGDALPKTWSGAPAASTTLVDTNYRLVSAPLFKPVAGIVGEEVTRLSIGWMGLPKFPRTVFLITARKAAPSERKFEGLKESGQLLADILEQLPAAFEGERRLLRQTEAEIRSSMVEWETERDRQQSQLDVERDRLYSFDGQPASLEGIAARLNLIFKQVSDLRAVSRPVVESRPPERQKASNFYPTRPPQPSLAHHNAGGDEATQWIVFGAAVFFVICIVAVVGIIWMRS